MDKKRPAIIIGIVAVALIALFVSRRGPPPAPLVKDDLAITRTLSKGKERANGQVYVPFMRSERGDRYKYVNIAVDLNGDGKIEAYDAAGGRQEEWLVRNFGAFVVGGAEVGFPVRIPDLGISGRLPLKAVVVLGPDRIAGDAWPAATAGQRFDVTVRRYAVDDRDELFVTDGKGTLDTGGPGTGGRRLAVAMPAGAAEAPAPAEPGTYRHQREDIPDQDQRYNECSPTGISDNFRWLAKKYGFEDRMPATTEALINELKGDLQWKNGVTPGQNTINGKRAFIARRKLPLEAHIVGEEFDPHIQYKIFQELEKGQAVELGLLFLKPEADGGESSDGAHLVSVAGTLRVDTDRFISIIDPGTHSNGIGSRYEVYRMDRNELKEYDSEDKTVIRYAYAQSPILDAAGNLVDPGRNEDFILRPGEPLTEPASDITVARGAFGFFSAAMDHPGDHMVGESFTVRATVTRSGRKTSMRYWTEQGGGGTYEFGAGSPWSLQGHFLGRGPLTPDSVTSKPSRTDVPGQRYQVEASFTCTRPGLAHVRYVANLAWPHEGGPLPAGLPKKYERQVDSQQDLLVVEAPPFRCMTLPEPPKHEQSRAAPSGDVRCPGIDADPSGKEIGILVIDGKCFPKAEFHVGEPDNCKARHWHWNGRPVVSFDGAKMDDPNPHECGFGKVGEVREGTIKVNPDQIAPYLGGILGR